MSIARRACFNYCAAWMCQAMRGEASGGEHSVFELDLMLVHFRRLLSALEAENDDVFCFDRVMNLLTARLAYARLQARTSVVDLVEGYMNDSRMC